MISLIEPSSSSYFDPELFTQHFFKIFKKWHFVFSIFQHSVEIVLRNVQKIFDGNLPTFAYATKWTPAGGHRQLCCSSVGDTFEIPLPPPMLYPLGPEKALFNYRETQNPVDVAKKPKGVGAAPWSWRRRQPDCCWSSWRRWPAR